MDKDLTKEDTQMANKHMKRCSISCVSSEWKIKVNETPLYIYLNGQNPFQVE